MEGVKVGEDRGGGEMDREILPRSPFSRGEAAVGTSAPIESSLLESDEDEEGAGEGSLAGTIVCRSSSEEDDEDEDEDSETARRRRCLFLFCGI